MTEDDFYQLKEQAYLQPPYPNPLFPPSLYYIFLKLLARKMCSRLSVVLGVCGGGCCLHLAKGYDKGTVVGVDISYDHPEQLRHIKNECPNFIFIQGDSIASANVLREKNVGKVDILFLDTDHTYERTMSEFNAYRSLLSSRAVVCLDDLFRPGMEEAYQKLPGKKMRLDDLHIGGSPTDGGFAILWEVSNV